MFKKLGFLNTMTRLRLTAAALFLTGARAAFLRVPSNILP